MLIHLRNNSWFYLLLLTWWLLGSSFAIAGSILVVLSALFFRQANFNEELFIGFMFTLILSDKLDFASTTKNIYIVLFSFFFFLSGNEMRMTNTFFFRFIPFFLVAVFCLLFSESVSTAAQKTLSYLLLLISVPNYVENIYRKSGTDFFKNVVYFNTVVLAIGLLYYFLLPETAFLDGRYRGAFFINPNGLGLYCLMVFLLLAVLVEFYPAMFEKREKIILFAIVLLSLYLTRSRNSLVSVIIFYSFRYFYRLSPFLGFIIFIIFLFLYQFVIDNLPYIIIGLGLQEYFRIDTLSTGSGRTIAWHFAWEHIQDNYFFGKGISYTEYLYRKNYTYLSNLGHQGNAHNSYLTFWLDTGLVGLVLYMFGFISLFIKAAGYTRLAMPVMYAVLFSIFFESWLTASLNPVTIILLLIITIIASDNIPKTEMSDSIEAQEEDDVKTIEA